MTYIPDSRLKKFVPPFGKEERENPYWEGNLNPENKEFVKAYDLAVEDALSLFDSLWEINFAGCMVDGNAVLHAPDIEDYRDLDENETKLLASMNPETRAIVEMKAAMKFHLENTRNELVVGLIDGQPEED